MNDLINQIYDVEAIKKQIEEITALLTENQSKIKEYAEAYKQLGTQAKVSSSMKELSQIQDKINSSMKDAAKIAAENVLTNAKLEKAHERLAFAQSEEGQALAKLNIEIQNQNKINKQAAQESQNKLNITQKINDALTKEATTERELAQSISELQKLGKDLNFNDAEQLALKIELNAKIDQQKNAILGVTDVETARIKNIGNYKSVLDGLILDEDAQNSILAVTKQKYGENSKQYQEAASQIEKYRTNLKGSSAAMDENIQKTEGFKTKLLKIKEEMYELSLATDGMNNATAEQKNRFNELQTVMGQMVDVQSDVSARAKILADDYRQMTTALEGVKLGVAMFQGFQSSLQLIGVENESVTKGIQKMMAAQMLMNSISQVQKSLNKDAYIMIQLQMAAESKYIVVRNVATVAQKALNFAMKAAPYAIVAAAIAGLIYWIVKMTKKNEEGAKSQEQLNDELERFKELTREAFNIESLLLRIKNKNLLTDAGRLKLLEDINSTLPKGVAGFKDLEKAQQFLQGDAKKIENYNNKLKEQSEIFVINKENIIKLTAKLKENEKILKEQEKNISSAGQGAPGLLLSIDKRKKENIELKIQIEIQKKSLENAVTNNEWYNRQIDIINSKYAEKEEAEASKPDKITEEKVEKDINLFLAGKQKELDLIKNFYEEELYLYKMSLLEKGVTKEEYDKEVEKKQSEINNNILQKQIEHIKKMLTTEVEGSEEQKNLYSDLADYQKMLKDLQLEDAENLWEETNKIATENIDDINGKVSEMFDMQYSIPQRFGKIVNQMIGAMDSEFEGKGATTLENFGERFSEIMSSESDTAKEFKRVLSEEIIGGIGDAVNSAFDMVNISLNNQMTELDESKAKMDEFYSDREDQIENATMSDTERARQLAELEAEKKKTDEINLKKENAIKNKQAKAAKAQQLANAVISGALGLVNASASGAQFGVLAPVMIPLLMGLVGAASAFSIAKILMTKVPSYAAGTDDHAGGLAIFGEAGNERVELPSGQSFISTSTTIADLPKHTKVIPLEKNASSTIIERKDVNINIDSNGISIKDAGRWDYINRKLNIKK